MAFPHGVVPTTETCVQSGWPSDCRVYPTPLYEFFIWLAIAVILRRMGSKFLREPMARGEIFCMYLILTGIARFLIDLIRINPRSFFGMSNAQAASVVSVALGVVLLVRIKSHFRAPDKTGAAQKA
jgi:phosphatidylglycerol:prolipoprotein diacylglycerol transferase